MRLAGGRRKLVEVTWALGLEMALVVSALITFPIIIRALGRVRYAEYTTLYIIAGFAITWVYASGGPALVQIVLQKRRTLASAKRVGRRQVLVLAVPAAVIGLIITQLMFGSDLIPVAVVIFTGDLVIAGLADVNISAVYALTGTSGSVVVRLVIPLVRTVSILGLFVIDSISLTTLVLTNFAAAIGMFGVSVVMLRRAEAAEPPHDEAGDTTPRELLRYTAAYGMTISANAVQDQGEKLALASTQPKPIVAEYNAAYSVVSMTMLPLRAVNIAAARWFMPKDDSEGGQVTRSLRLLAPTAAYSVLAGIGIVLMTPLTAILVGDEFTLATTITIWLCGFPLVRSAADVAALGLIGLGENRARMYVGFAGASVAVAGYAIAVPPFGWQGAVVATYVSEIVTVVGGWSTLVRCQRRRDARSRAEPLAAGRGPSASHAVDS